METKGLTNKALAAALAAVVGGGVAANAQAGALATSIQQLSNFQIQKNDSFGNPIGALDKSDFSALTFTSGADASASLNGSGVSDSDTANSANPLDLAPQCVGDCPAGANNAFPMVSSGLGDPSANFSQGDTNQTGAPITGLGAPLGAIIESGSWVSLAKGDQNGSADANNDLSSTFQFVLNQSGGLTFSFDADSYLEAFTSSDQVFPADANASYSIGFSIEEVNTGNLVMDWRPDGNNNPGAHTGITGEQDPYSLNRSISRNAPFNGVSTANHTLATKSTGSFWASTVNLTAGTTYQLTARANTDVDATTVPAPGALALMGIGLIGMGAATRRRRTLSA